jgi:sensor domain CHASE-containing protein
MLLQNMRTEPSKFGGFGRRVVLPVTILVAGAMTLVLAFVLVSSARQDAIALDASTRLAQTALSVKEREIGRNLKDYAVWEDAYQNLHVKLDLDWAATDGNVGANIKNSLGYDMAFVIDPAGRTAYAVLDGEPQTADAHALIADGFDELLKKAAAGEEPVVGLLHAGSEIVMVAATPILPPQGTGEPPPVGARSLLVFGKKLDQGFLATMSEQYLLTGLTLVDADGTSVSASSRIVPSRSESVGKPVS